MFGKSLISQKLISLGRKVVYGGTHMHRSHGATGIGFCLATNIVVVHLSILTFRKGPGTTPSLFFFREAFLLSYVALLLHTVYK